MAKAPKKPSTSRPEPKILLKADSVNVAFSADKEGHLRANCGTFETPVVCGAGEVFELRWERGQVVMTKRPR